MSFDKKGISMLAHSNGFVLHHYRTQDFPADVSGDGYFDAAGEDLRAGDMILANTAEASACLFLVVSAEEGSVTVSELTMATGR